MLSLFDEEWQYELRSDPETATSLGDNRYNDRLSDRSPQFYQSDEDTRRKFLSRFEAIDPAGLPAQDALSRELMIRNLRQDIAGARFKPWEMPVNQMNGPHLGLLELVTLTPFNSVKDYDDYLSRLHQVPRMLEQVTGNMRQGNERRVDATSLPAGKSGAANSGDCEHRGRRQPVCQAGEQISRRHFRAGSEAPAIGGAGRDQREILPAYERFAAFVRDDYAPHGRTEPGVWALPDGAERYRFQVDA